MVPAAPVVSAAVRVQRDLAELKTKAADEASADTDADATASAPEPIWLW